MLPLKYIKAWKVLGYALVVTLIILSIIPTRDLNRVLFVGSDKVIHFLYYGILMIWFGQTHDENHYISLAWKFVALGLALEIVQHLLPVRTFDVFDFFADALGVLAGYGFAMYNKGTLFLSIERFIFKNPITSPENPDS